MARGKKKDSDAAQGPEVDPLKVALEKGRAEREAQEHLGEFRRLLSQAAGFSNPGPTWGTDYTKPVDYEREGLLRPSHEKWPEANEEFSRQWVGLWRQLAEVARKAGMVERIQALDPSTSVLRRDPGHLRPLFVEMHGLFARVLVGDAKKAATVARDLSVLRARCEPTPDEMKRGNVLMNRRWDAGKYFSWLRSETGRWATRPSSVDRGHVTGLAREHCLVTGVPEDAARALVDMMCVLGVLDGSSEGGVEIPGKPGVLGDRPEVAGEALRQVVSKWITANAEFAVLGALVVGSRASGSGAGLAKATPGDQLADIRAKLQRTQDDLHELTSSSTEVIERMGKSVAPHATLLVGTIRAWLEREAKALGAALREAGAAASKADESLSGSGMDGEAKRKSGSTPTAPTAAADCSWICAGGVKFDFEKSNQRAVIRALHQEWVKSGSQDGCGLGPEGLMDARGVRLERVRIDKLFKGHAALGTLLRRTAPGVWALFMNNPFGPPTGPPT